MRRAHAIFSLVGVCLTGLAACADFPEIAEANRDAGAVGAAPPLLPFSELFAVTAVSSGPPEGVASLEARAAALRTRAAILNTPLRAPGDIDRIRARLR